jgi:hypothetical protein
MANLSDIIHGGSATAGNRVLITSSTASSSSSIDFTSSIGSTYDYYEVEIINLVPATDNVDLYLRISTDTGSTWKSGVSDYAFSGYAMQSGSATVETEADNSEAFILCNCRTTNTDIGSASTDSYNALVVFAQPDDTGTYFTSRIDFWNNSSAVMVEGAMCGSYLTAGAIDGVRFIMSSGNITSGEFNLYGIKK